MQLGMLEPKPRDVYYEDVYGRPDVDKDDVQDDMFDICESSSDGDDDDDSGNAIGESSTMIYQTVSSADLPYDANNDTIGE